MRSLRSQKNRIELSQTVCMQFNFITGEISANADDKTLPFLPSFSKVLSPHSLALWEYHWPDVYVYGFKPYPKSVASVYKQEN